MFERRLKVFLGIILLAATALVLRAGYVQVVSAGHWRHEAERAMVRPLPVETVRGRLLDVRGTPLAEDAPCIDASVDYRAVVRPADPKWLRDTAAERLRRRDPEFGAMSRSAREPLVAAEAEKVQAEVDRTW